jgi:alpha-glucosidase
MSFQTNTVINPGIVQEIKTEKTGASGRSEHAQFKIDFVGDGIVNIKFTRQPDFEYFSYAVVEVNAEPPLDINDSSSHFEIQSSKLKVVVQKDSSHISFYNKQDQLLNADEKGLGTTWNGEQVTTYKKLIDGERFIGLGEKTGPLDRRGQGYQNWNTDVFAYGPGSDPLYCTIPFYIGIH